jgi:hypothetical protein
MRTGWSAVDGYTSTIAPRLAARLHLIFTPIAHRHELLDERVAVELPTRPDHHRLDRLDMRTEALHERAHGRDHDRREMIAADTEPPDDAQAPAHRLDRRRDTLERERLPRREELDRVGAEELAQVGREPLGLVAGRHREHHRSARRNRRERRAEQCTRRLRDRNRARHPARRGGDDGVRSEQ